MVEEFVRELTDHEGRIKVLEKSFDKLDHILEAITRLEQQMSDRHTPASCPQRAVVDDHETRLRILEEVRSMAVGGAKVIYWLIGSNAIAIVLLILSLMGN